MLQLVRMAVNEVTSSLCKLKTKIHVQLTGLNMLDLYNVCLNKKKQDKIIKVYTFYKTKPKF
jgi:hypothetical protein